MKTVLVISIYSDANTAVVCQWLKHLKQPYLLVTPQSEVEVVAIYDNGDIQLKIDGKHIKGSEIKSSWYRRGEFSIEKQLLSVPETENRQEAALYLAANNYIRLDYGDTITYLYSWLRNKPHIDSILTANVNKLVVLNKAAELGLTIPAWAVLSTKAEVSSFKQAQAQLITKSVAGTGFFLAQSYYVQAYTEEVDDDFFTLLPETFPPSFFQKMVDKELEIRSYLLNEAFYSMAIFSQQNEQTAVDFRKYDRERPNRRVPFKLPRDLEEKLLKLAKLLKMDSCSFDLIYGKDSAYYFLEVNPVGQYGMTSSPCNYRIDKQIAELLAGNNTSQA